MNDITVYTQTTIDEQVVKTRSFCREKQGHITFHKQLALQKTNQYELLLSR